MRLDSLAGAIRFVVERLDFDTKTVIEAKRRTEAITKIAIWNDPVSRREWLTGVIDAKDGRVSRNNLNKTGRCKRNRFIKLHH